ncbi:hypothetical protein N9219_01705 [bacterium]|nr:hypothetical protein [bacterium]
MIVYDGMDEAIIYAIPHRDSYIIVYDRDLIVNILMERDGMEYIIAQEYIDFNIDCMYVGEFTPVLYEEEESND